MPISKTQRFILYMLTLLLVWVNGVAAPYQHIKNATAKEAAISSYCPHVGHETTIAHASSYYQHPIPASERGLHSTDPAEETFEEKEESHRKDSQDLPYFVLPLHLTVPNLVDIFYPIYFPHHHTHIAVRNQYTYLLDCTFLI